MGMTLPWRATRNERTVTRGLKLELPGDSVGISDILNYRGCAQRFGFGMRRHVELPERFAVFEGEKDEPPEHESYASAYGHAAHDGIQIIEDSDCSDDEAIDAVWPFYHHWLEPADIPRLKSDFQTFRQRSDLGWRVWGTELELRTPLLKWNGRVIYFRGRIDVLYQHIENPTVFMSRDYKTSRWRVSEADVHKDPQQWSYNLLIHDTIPECESLTQIYDQLRFGDIPTSKTDEQRTVIRGWLRQQVKAILGDNTLRPTINDECQYCPILMDCREVKRATKYTQAKIAAMTGMEEKGRSLIMRLDDSMGYEDYAEFLPKAKMMKKVVDKYVEEVEAALKAMPQSERERLGFDLGRPRRVDRFSPAALRALHERYPDQFYALTTVTKKNLESMFGADSDEMNAILELAEKVEQTPSLKART